MSRKIFKTTNKGCADCTSLAGTFFTLN